MNHNSAIWRKLPLATSLLAVVAGIWAKLSLTTGDLLPGLDGAYYWVQVRSVINNSALAFSDLPLVFWVQAAMAKVFGDVELAVRLSDALLPALSAIPLYLIAKRFSNPFLPAIAILAVLLNPVQLYFFTGDFIKNEATIPAVFFISWVLITWDRRSKKVSIAFLALASVVSALSHFGTLLTALLLVGVWVLAQLRKSKGEFWLKAFAAAIAISAGTLALLYLLVPTRYERLISFVTTPSAIFENPALDGILHNYSGSVMAVTIVIGQLASIILGIIVWLSRSKFTFSDLSLVIASLVTTFILSSPFIGMEWSDRLAAQSFVPLSIAAILIFGTLDLNWQKIPVVALAALTLFSTIALSNTEMKYVLTSEKYADFREMAAQVKIPDNSVIVARHGVEYLSAWEFNSDVALESYYESADLTSYSAVYYIQEIQMAKADIPSTSSSKSDPKGPPPSDGKTPPNGMAPPNSNGKSDVTEDLAKSDPITGETVYQNASFTLVKVR